MRQNSKSSPFLWQISIFRIIIKIKFSNLSFSIEEPNSFGLFEKFGPWICHQKPNFSPKIKMFVNRKFRHKSKISSKIESFVKNRNFLSKIHSFIKNRKFCQKSKFFSKIESFVKNRKFCQKSKFFSKIESFVKKSKVLSKIEIFVKNQNFGQKSKFQGPKFSTKI